MSARLPPHGPWTSNLDPLCASAAHAPSRSSLRLGSAQRFDALAHGSPVPGRFATLPGTHREKWDLCVLSSLSILAKPLNFFESALVSHVELGQNSRKRRKWRLARRRKPPLWTNTFMGIYRQKQKNSGKICSTAALPESLEKKSDLRVGLLSYPKKFSRCFSYTQIETISPKRTRPNSGNITSNSPTWRRPSRISKATWPCVRYSINGRTGLKPTSSWPF